MAAGRGTDSGEGEREQGEEGTHWLKEAGREVERGRERTNTHTDVHTHTYTHTHTHTHTHADLVDEPP